MLRTGYALRRVGDLYHIATNAVRIYRICEANISHERSEYIVKKVMTWKTKQ